MRKQTKIAALVSAAALLAIGASMTSLAAGWTYDQDAGYWVYKDNDGYNVEYEWHKWTDGQWCYLGEGGKCVADELVDYNGKLYYLNSSGFRVLGAWHFEENVDGETLDNGDVPSGFWYYLGSNGVAVKGEQKINDKYYRFDDDYRLLAGWQQVGDKWYYYNDTVDATDSAYGEALTKWQEMPLREGEVDDQDLDTYWFYFTDKGEMYTGSKYFDKKWWYFDETTGALQTGWKETSTPSVAKDNAPDYVYYNESSAKQKSGWIYVSDKYVVDGKNDSTGTYWFYVTADGTRVRATGDGTNQDGTKVGILRVKGKNYLLDNQGRMLDGVQVLDGVKYIQGGSTTEDFTGTYYFSEDDWATGGSNGAMLVNTKKTVVDEYDNGTDYYFSKSGAAYADAIVGNSYYNTDGEKVVGDYGEVAIVTVNETEEEDNKVTGTRVYKSNGTVDSIKFGANDQIFIRENGNVARNTIVNNVYGYRKYFIGRLPSSKTEIEAFTGVGSFAGKKVEDITGTLNPYVVTGYVVVE